MMLPRCRVLLGVLLLLAVTARAAENLDYSGSYTEVVSKHDSKSKQETVSTIKVVQSATAIEVTRVTDGKSYFNKFPLDGSEGEYVSSGGVPGRCKAHFKGKYMYLESFVTVRPLPHGPAVQINTKQRWELSPDMKKLTIRTDVDTPNMPTNPVDPWTEIYTRD